MAYRASDLHHLPLRSAERFDQRERIDVEIERLLRLLGRDIDLAINGEEFLHAKFEVLRNGHRGNEARLLVDHGDAVLQRLAGRRERNLRPAQNVVA